MIVRNVPWSGHPHPERHSMRMSLGGGPPPEGVCCQAAPDGGTVCSNGFHGPPGCPKCPDHNVPGVAEYEQVGNALIPKLPSPDSCGGVVAAGGVGGALTVAGILGVLGAGAYFLFK